MPPNKRVDAECLNSRAKWTTLRTRLSSTFRLRTSHMSAAAVFFIVRNGDAKIYFHKWAAEFCLIDLESGPDWAHEQATDSDNEEIDDFPFSEAGYLLDFDTKTMIFYGSLGSVLKQLELGEFEDPESQEAISTFVNAIAPKWTGWAISTDDIDNTQIDAHLESRGIAL